MSVIITIEIEDNAEGKKIFKDIEENLDIMSGHVIEIEVVNEEDEENEFEELMKEFEDDDDSDYDYEYDIWLGW